MFTIKNIGELNTVINNSKDWKAQHQAFGTHLPKSANAETLSGIATRMIAQCDLWKTHWGMILDDRKEELDRLRNEQVTAKAKAFVDYDDEQWERLCAERNRLRGVQPAQQN